MEARFTWNQAIGKLLIKYARPEFARRMRAHRCCWRGLGQGNNPPSPQILRSHRLVERQSRERTPEERRSQPHWLRQSGTRCDRIRWNACHVTLEIPNPTTRGASGPEHVNARSAGNAASPNSPHTDSCNRECDASRTRRRCATASSEASSIEKTRPRGHSSVS